MADEDIWKRRFFLFMGARLLGLVTFLTGVAIAFTGVIRPGGWPALGAAIIVLGLVDAVATPLLLKRQWKKQDEGRE